METAATLAVFALALVLFLLDRPRHDLVALVCLLALSLTGALAPAEAFAGFSSPAILAAAGLFVFSRAFVKTGLLRAMGEKFLSAFRREATIVFALSVFSGILSALVFNAAVAAAILPALLQLGRDRGIAPSRLLLPLSFSVLLGGMASLAGSSTNWGVQAVLESSLLRANHPEATSLELFEFLPIGLGLVVLSALYFSALGKRILPERRAEKDLAAQYRVRQFLCEVRVEASSSLTGKTIAESGLGARENATVLGMARRGEPIPSFGPATRIEAGDLLLLQGEPQNLLKLQADLSLTLQEESQRRDVWLEDGDDRIREGIVAPGSRYAGQTLQEIGFRGKTGLNVIALWRHGEVYPLGLKEMPLRVGDALLLQGDARDFDRLRRDGDFLLTESIEAPAKPGKSAWIAAALFVAALAVGGAGLVAMPLALLTAATLLVLFRVLPLRDAYESVDWPLLLLLVGCLALSGAFVKHGLSGDVASFLWSLAPEGQRLPFFLGVLFVTSAVLAQLTRNQASAVLVAPIAVALAVKLPVEIPLLILPVIAGASCSFLTPYGHQANSMMMGPGGYRYSDYTRAGLPLLVLVGVATVFLGPLVL